LFQLGSSTRGLRAAIIAALSLAGCRTYELRPLDICAAEEAWLHRSVADETVREFAARLAATERAQAETFDPTDGLTLSEAEPVALVFNRGLRVARLEARVAMATSEESGRWEDPIAGVDLERILESVSDPWVVAASIGITIPISGRLDAESAHADAEYRAALHAVAQREWETRIAVRETWIRWSSHLERAALLEQLVANLRSVAELATRQEEGGVLSRIDARVFRVELAGRETDAEALRAQVNDVELELRDLLGLAPTAPLQLVAALALDAPAGGERELRQMMLMRNPELLASAELYEVAELALRREIREQYPDLTIGPGYADDQGESRALFRLALPIPLWNRNQKAVAEATAAREAARARYEGTYERLSAHLVGAYRRHLAAREVREAIEHRVIPLALEQAEDVRRVASMGRVDAMLQLQAIDAQHEARLRLIDARAAEAIAAVRIQALLGPDERGAGDSTATQSSGLSERSATAENGETSP